VSFDRPLFLLLLMLTTQVSAVATSASDSLLDPVALDAWWDFDRPAESEQRFRARLGTLPANSAARPELLTQIARAQALQRKFDAAHATLDDVEQQQAEYPPRVAVPYLLERGRVFNSSKQPGKGMPLSREAPDKARAAHEDFLAIDAAHMLAIAAPPEERLKWNLEALEMTERTADARAKRWLASLYNNIGWTYHEAGDYATALAYFEKALPAWETRGNTSAVQTAKWMIGRALRSLQRYDEAMAIQRALLAEQEKNGDADGYVYEEIAELELARGRNDVAQPWFAKAYATLCRDAWLKSSEPARLERMRKLGSIE